MLWYFFSSTTVYFGKRKYKKQMFSRDKSCSLICLNSVSKKYTIRTLHTETNCLIPIKYITIIINKFPMFITFSFHVPLADWVESNVKINHPLHKFCIKYKHINFTKENKLYITYKKILTTNISE